MIERQFDFGEQMRMSEGVSATAAVRDILMENISGASDAVKSSRTDDKNGIDWWVNLANGMRIGVDCKIREEDWMKRGKDDLALETWSVIETQKVGWTRDENKKTDYILWLWKDSGRWCLVPFRMLCAVFQDQLKSWREKYRVARQETKNGGETYHSECVFVSRQEVWSAIYARFGGNRIEALEMPAPLLLTIKPPAQKDAEQLWLFNPPPETIEHLDAIQNKLWMENHP